MFRVVSPLLASLLVAGLCPPASAAAEAPRCTPVHVIQASGTGFSHSWDTSRDRPLLDDDSSPAHDLQARFGPDTVSTFRLAYPATTARFNGVTGSNATGGEDAHDGTEPLTYGESHAIGLERTLAHLEQVAADCPTTKFMLVGFSQGSHILGDAASLAARGKVAGVGADSIAAVTLFADPARSPLAAPAEVARPSRLYGPAPAGETAANFETVNSGGRRLDPATVGMAGTRAGNFNGLQGKVLSLCNPSDMACASTEGSLVRTLADIASRVENPVPGTGPTVVTPELVRAAFEELTLMARTGHRVNGAGLSPAQMGAVVLLNALPSLIREAGSYRVLEDTVGGMRDALAGSSQSSAAFDAFMAQQKVAAPARQDALFAAASQACEGFARVTGVKPLMDDPRYAELARSARMAGDFGPQHFAYYREGYTQNYRIGGKTGYDYAVGWMSEVAEGVAKGVAEGVA